MKFDISGAGIVCHPVSPPVRGAWVEIHPGLTSETPAHGSPPVRGAWVEIYCICRIFTPEACRPLCGGRGLKLLLRHQRQGEQGRPLCGGRGLKLLDANI